VDGGLASDSAGAALDETLQARLSTPLSPCAVQTVSATLSSATSCEAQESIRAGNGAGAPAGRRVDVAIGLADGAALPAGLNLVATVDRLPSPAPLLPGSACRTDSAWASSRAPRPRRRRTSSSSRPSRAGCVSSAPSEPLPPRARAFPDPAWMRGLISCVGLADRPPVGSYTVLVQVVDQIFDLQADDSAGSVCGGSSQAPHVSSAAST
jgi:hypothetical protein